MRVRFKYTDSSGIRKQTGWENKTQEEVESMYMDYLSKFYKDIIVEQKVQVDITNQIKESWGLSIV